MRRGVEREPRRRIFQSFPTFNYGLIAERFGTACSKLVQTLGKFSPACFGSLEKYGKYFIVICSRTNMDLWRHPPVGILMKSGL